METKVQKHTEEVHSRGQDLVQRVSSMEFSYLTGCCLIDRTLLTFKLLKKDVGR